MILSKERQSHFAHVITDGLSRDDIVDFADDDEAVRFAKVGVVKFVQEAEAIDTLVREKIASLKRGVAEGTPEFDVMYGKYYEEELARKGG